MKALSYAAFILSALTAGCGGSDSGDRVDNGKVISEVEITPDETAMDVGSSVQFHATVHYADGTTKDATSDSSTLWNTSNASVATVSGKGLVNAVKVGAVEISADFKGEKGDESFAVTP